MKIAVFSDNFYPELSGIADSIITTGEELAKRGHAVHFFAPRYSMANYATVNRIPKEIDPGKGAGVTRFASFPFPTGTG
ncbi:MAG: hypothetical protein AAB652_02050, partial [Patescibacteria group bacterium]